MTAGKRGVLKGLDRLGPQTVPQMARARPVSRQHIQTLVNQLAAEGHLELVENPAHRRSHLVRLTPQGKGLVDSMSRREEKVLTRLKFDIPDKDLRAAAAVLRAVRHMLESDHWRRLVKSIR
jgi:DNA-binding MarR family transcriptional regulator